MTEKKEKFITKYSNEGFNVDMLGQDICACVKSH